MPPHFDCEFDREQPADWHPQDWILIAQALQDWERDRRGRASPRAWRARQLVLRIAEYIDCPEQEIVEQVDEQWLSLNQR